MPKRLSIIVILGLATGLGFCTCLAQKPVFELIKPSETGTIATKFDDPNMVVRPAKMEGAPPLVWLPGTGGKQAGMVEDCSVRAIARCGHGSLHREEGEGAARGHVLKPD
jgi:hypothetical protein